MIGGTRPGERPKPSLVGQSGLYVTGEDYLLLTSLNAAASVRLTISGRVLGLDGRPVPFSGDHVPNTDRTAGTLVVQLGEGWLEHVSVGIASGTPVFAQTFVRVDLARGGPNARTVLGTLLQGLVSSTFRQAWPGAILAGPLERAGALRVLTGTDPAANVEISETVPTGARWRVLSMRVQLVTDATAANREVAVTFDDGTTVFYEAHSGVNQAASLTRQYTAALTSVRGAAATGTGILIPIPDLTLLAGHRVRTSTTNRQAGDNFGAPLLLVEESLEG